MATRSEYQTTPPTKADSLGATWTSFSPGERAPETQGSVIHITVDPFNNAFVHQDRMGVSLLKGAVDRRSFEDAVAHELHHVGFRFWAARDDVRQALLQERNGHSVAVQHVQNLLAEGLANYYCTPGYVFSAESREPPTSPLKALALDLEDRLLPAAQITFLMGEIYGQEDPVLRRGKRLFEHHLDECARDAGRGYWIRARDGEREEIEVYTLTHLLLSSLVDAPRRLQGGYDVSDPRVRRILEVLVEIQGQDGGWRPFFSEESSPLYTVLAVEVLVLGGAIPQEDLVDLIGPYAS